MSEAPGFPTGHLNGESGESDYLLRVLDFPNTPIPSFREGIRVVSAGTNFLGEGRGRLPYNLDVLLKGVLEDYGELVTLPTTGEGFSEDVPEAQFFRVTGRQLYGDKRTRFLYDHYRDPWLVVARVALGNEHLEAFDDPNDALVLNALVEPGQFFPVHTDKTGGSGLLGGSHPPKSHKGGFYVSGGTEAVGISGVRRMASATPPEMELGRITFFDGSDKLHGSEGIEDGDEPRITIALSYDDPTRPLERPAAFRKFRRSRTGNSQTV